MLILRVMAGEAWGDDTLGSTIRFSPGSEDMSGSQWFDSRARVHLQTLSNVHPPASDRCCKVRISEV